MKALVKAEARPGIWMKDIPEPTIGPNDVLIKIAKTAICGTDMHIYQWDAWAQKTIPVPMAVGHEYYGRIVDMGSEVRGFAAGGLALLQQPSGCRCPADPLREGPLRRIGVERHEEGMRLRMGRRS